MLLFSLALLLYSCAGHPNIYRDIDQAVHREDFEQGIKAIENGQKEKRPLYPDNNAISLYLDKGLLEHYAGRNAESSLNLEQAERLIEEAFTKSITAGIASYIINDNVKNYPGEDYEDIYINVFNALNYYNRGNLDGAMVEIRKITMSSGKLDMLSRKYENMVSPLSDWVVDQLRDMGLIIHPSFPQGEAVNFSNSALARYLGALFYLGSGKQDDARIEFEQIRAAFNSNPNIYKNPFPASVTEAMHIPPDKARLNLIAFTGLSPVKEEFLFPHIFPFLFNPPLRVPVFKLPGFVDRGSVIDHIDVVVNKNSAFSLELLEDMGAVIKETYNARFSSLLLKTYARILLKYAAIDISVAIRNTKSPYTDALMYATISKIVADASESADIRMGRYLPDKAYIGGVNLDPGTYTVTFNYYSGKRIVARDKHENVSVKAGALNLLESISLK